MKKVQNKINKAIVGYLIVLTIFVIITSALHGTNIDKCKTTNSAQHEILRGLVGFDSVQVKINNVSQQSMEQIHDVVSEMLKQINEVRNNGKTN